MSAEGRAAVLGVRYSRWGLKGEQEFLDFFEAGLGGFAGEARELAAEGDEVALSGEHDSIFLGFDARDVTLGSKNAKFGDLEQVFDRFRRRAEAISEFAAQGFERFGGQDLGEAAVEFDAVVGLGHVRVREMSRSAESGVRSP